MTLKEKFKQIDIKLSKNHSTKIVDVEAIQCEKIADEFAIEFAEWLYRWDNTRLTNGNWIIRLGLKPYTSKELLEIFKNEKGL